MDKEALLELDIPCFGMEKLGYAACICIQQGKPLIELELENEPNTIAGSPCITDKMARQELESKHDALTGLRNLRGLPVEFQERAKTGEKFGILFVDIANFKEINKSGHLAGDYALQFISNLLQLEFREEDVAFAMHEEDEVLIRDKTGKTSVIYRKGGDEFILFINHPDIDDAMLEDMGNRFSEALKSREETQMYHRVAPADKQLGVHAKGMVYDPADPFTLETVLSQGDPKASQENIRFNMVEVIFRGAKERTDAEVAEMHARRAELAEQQHRRLDDE
jgi:GGDEF domain-containing protein